MQDRFKFRHFNKLVKKMTYYDNPEMQVCLNGDFKSGLLFPMSEEFEDNAMYMGSYENLQQCTGLKDKNGKLIYEGDICRSEEYPFKNEEDDNYRAEICYDKDTANYYYYTFKISNRIIGRCEGNTGPIDEYEWEVVGNIYENPELLKVGE